jgi:primosomal protein N' (replication factor Y)
VTAPGRLFDPDEAGTEPIRTTTSPPSSGEVVVRVAPDVSGLDKEFDYAWRAELIGSLSIGSLVGVELHGRPVHGWVTGVGLDPAGFDLLPVTRVLSVGPPAELVELGRWAAWRWSGRLAAVLKTASPPRRIAALPAAPPARPAGTRSGACEPLVSGAFAGPGVSVVRLGPSTDVLPWLLAAGASGDTVVIAPRLDLARQLAGRLRRHGLRARLHPQDWAAAAGRGGLAIGARSAVWARLPDLASIVVLDEHDEALQAERNPTWHARDVAVERARRAGVPCLLLSPCPSLAALAAADRCLEPARDVERASWPVIEVVDRRRDERGRGGLFSSRVAALVRGPGRVLAVLNRKGRAVMLACATCGELARTEDGERLMAEDGGQLRCAATGETRPLVCAACGASALKRLRLGVSRAAEELAALAGEPVDELAGAAGRHERATTRVVVGTEAALHQLDRVESVVFLDFDQELLAPRYRAAEQAMALLVLAARLTGGRDQGGRVVVQTRSADHRVLRAAVRADPGRFAAEERDLRRSMGLPPFGALAEISGAGAGELVAPLGRQPGVTVLGPRHDGRYLLRAGGPEALAAVLARAERPAARVRVAVDPPRA